jgi:membrane-associated phospholipid phosphatase
MDATVDPGWPTPVEIAIVGGVSGGAFLATALIDDAGSRRWTHGFLFDDAARDALRASDSGQSTVSAISDAMRIGLLIAPLGTAAATFYLADAKTAAQLVAIDAEAYALSMSTVALLKAVIRRERPDAAADHCELRPADADCAKRVAKNSFPSSHAADSFVAASLICTEHLSMKIVGHAWDAGICATALGAATTVSVFRVVADRHYVSDIVAGAAIGALYGALFPSLVHFHRRATTVTLLPMVTPVGATLSAATRF